MSFSDRLTGEIGHSMVCIFHGKLLGDTLKRIIEDQDAELIRRNEVDLFSLLVPVGYGGDPIAYFMGFPNFLLFLINYIIQSSFVL